MNTLQCYLTLSMCRCYPIWAWGYQFVTRELDGATQKEYFKYAVTAFSIHRGLCYMLTLFLIFSLFLVYLSNIFMFSFCSCGLNWRSYFIQVGLGLPGKLFVKQLLERRPEERLGHEIGGWNYDKIRGHSFFSKMDWGKLNSRKLKAPKIKLYVKKKENIFDL